MAATVQGMHCPHYNSSNVIKFGTRSLQDESLVQLYRCHTCGQRFNERTGIPMARLRTLVETVEIAMKVRTEGFGVRATRRSLGKAHSSILRWQKRLAEHSAGWTPAAPAGSEVTLKGD